jgi:CheY-like chemotaxis protein
MARPAMPAPSGNASVLLVEDDAAVRRMAARELAGLGYRLHLAASGPEALRLLHSGVRVDLLFTDVVLPNGMNGYELAAAAKTLLPALRVLFTSGFACPPAEEAANPGSPLLPKPYRREELAERIHAVLARD